MDADDWIEKLALEAHPEGGHFRETYRSPDLIGGAALPPRYARAEGPRALSTAIYFLLQGSDFSSLHRIHADELWHFHTGSALELHVIHPSGMLVETRLGGDFDRGETFQAVVKAGCWFGATVPSASSYTLVSCTVAPGFDFRDFELAQRARLVEQFPQHEALIVRLTR